MRTRLGTIALALVAFGSPALTRRATAKKTANETCTDACAKTTARCESDCTSKFPHRAASVEFGHCASFCEQTGKSCSKNCAASRDVAPVRTGNARALDWLDLQPARRRIVVVTTSLKPGGPSEVIELAEHGDAVELGARRVPGEGDAERAKTTLDKNGLDAMWSLVEAEKLATASPPETDSAVADGAGHLMVLEWPDASGRAHVHALQWSNAKNAAAGIDRLFRKMAEIARSKLPSVRLSYFP
jgi:hypothetical protein